MYRNTAVQRVYACSNNWAMNIDFAVLPPPKLSDEGGCVFRSVYFRQPNYFEIWTDFVIKFCGRIGRGLGRKCTDLDSVVDSGLLSVVLYHQDIAAVTSPLCSLGGSIVLSWDLGSLIHVAYQFSLPECLMNPLALPWVFHFSYSRIIAATASWLLIVSYQASERVSKHK